jgi:hypothetical protein
MDTDYRCPTAVTIFEEKMWTINKTAASNIANL